LLLVFFDLLYFDFNMYQQKSIDKKFIFKFKQKKGEITKIRNSIDYIKVLFKNQLDLSLPMFVFFRTIKCKQLYN